MGFLSIGAILSFITGLAGPMAAIINKISDLKMAKVNAHTEEKKAEINQQIEEAHDKRAAIVAQAGSRIGILFLSIMQMLFVLPAAAIIAKIGFWDKVVGSLHGCAVKPLTAVTKRYCQEWFITDPLDSNMWWIILAIVSFLFVTTISSALKK